MNNLAASDDVDVEIADAARFASLAPLWRDLVGRAAEANVFMEPAVVQAADRTVTAGSVRVLLAWSRPLEEAPRRLLGAWALVTSRPISALPLRVLHSPTHELNFLATPVLDAERLVPVLAAMLDAIAGDARLPKFIMLREMGDKGPVMRGLETVLQRRGAQAVVLSRTRRARLESDLDGLSYFKATLSASTRKKLRQHRRRLARIGAVTRTSHRQPGEVRDALEEFLALEMAGWKGRSGTALLCDPQAADFARSAFLAMAEQRLAWIEALRVDGRPASMQILLRSGVGAFTWKIAYDEALRDHSPGILLVEDYTAALLADPAIAFADSCSHSEAGFMADMWHERQAVIDLMFDARSGRHRGFVATATIARAYRRARQTVKTTYLHVKRRSKGVAGGLRTRVS